MKRLELWLHDTNVKEDKQAARIVNSQTNGVVLDFSLDIPMAQLKTKEGMQLIIDAMEKTFGKDKAVRAWRAFDGGAKRNRKGGGFRAPHRKSVP